jgi:hypothetical protein
LISAVAFIVRTGGTIILMRLELAAMVALAAHDGVIEF